MLCEKRSESSAEKVERVEQAHIPDEDTNMIAKMEWEDKWYNQQQAGIRAAEGTLAAG